MNRGLGSIASAASALTLTMAMSIALVSCSQNRHALDLSDESAGVQSLGAAGNFSAVYQILSNNNCNSCHAPGGSAYDISGVQLDFSSQAQAYQTLLSKTVTGATSAGICGGVRIVAPGNAAASYLVGVLSSAYGHSDFAGVSGCTPYTGHWQDTNLTAAEQAAIINWIQIGAPNN